MNHTTDLTGTKFGKLTVLRRLPEQKGRYWLWLCRCDCGREIQVNTKWLRRTKMPSCPDCALTRPCVSADLTGKRFGFLTVESLSDTLIDKKRAWLCRCDCGNTILVIAEDLRRRRVRSCGCMSNDKMVPRYKNLTGKTIGMLTVLEATDERDYKGSVMWKCLCQCGTECIYSEDSLVHGNIVSCGCYREQILPKQLNGRLHRIDGTCVEHLKRNPRSDNKSGWPGIYEQPNGRWKVYIGFKGKKYYLGIFDDKNEALKARLKGEEMHDSFLDWYYNEHLLQKENQERDRCSTSSNLMKTHRI